MEDLMYASATSLAQAIRDRQISSSEVVGACLKRIEQVNPAVNAVAQLMAEEARRQAEEADNALARDEIRGPLHGVPFTVKDWIEVAGAVCAAGLKERAGFVPKRDATVVARMRAAGGIFLGKTIDGPGNPVYGTCHNPYDLARTPGGSSSGEAAIIASGGSPLGLGSDSGGSIRYPAHCCGVAGLKPSAGRVPLTGHFPRLDSFVDSRTQIGPLARYVEDLALVLSVIAGVDGRDPGVAPVPLDDWRAVDVRGLRVAVFTEFEGATPDSDTVATVRNAAAALADAGAQIEDAVPPRIDESWDITQVHWGRVRSWSWSEWRAGRDHRLSVDQIERGLFAWGRLQRAFLSFMEQYELIICPAAPDPASDLSSISERDFVFTLPFSLTGQPCVVVRAGASREGLPIGIQVVARQWRDDVAIAAARRIETELGGFRPPPLAP